MSSDCLSTFAQYFTILSAADPDLLRQTMALRYQVYCVEHGFDDTEKYPDGPAVGGRTPGRAANYLGIVPDNRGDVCRKRHKAWPCRHGAAVDPIAGWVRDCFHAGWAYG